LLLHKHSLSLLVLVVQQAALATTRFFQLSHQQQVETQARMKVSNQTARQVAQAVVEVLDILRQLRPQPAGQVQQIRVMPEERDLQTT
jgi:prephenate dehydratase